MDSVIHIKNKLLENEPFLISPTEQDSKGKASDCIILQRQLSIWGLD